jgi:glycosyltransferase involved in cell wall biosynthesis
MKMFEYLSIGVPIVSSDLPVLREVLVDGKNCLLVKAGDIGEWSAALQRIIEDVPLAEKLESNAYYEYNNRYTWKHCAGSIIDLLS